MKTLFLDCFSGISGDMTLGALVALGLKPSVLEWELSKLDLGDFHMHFEQDKRKDIAGIRFSIHEGSTHSDSCDHDHAHEHDHAHAHEHKHDHSCGHDHAHEHKHDHTCDHDHAHEHKHDHTCDHDHAHEHKHDHTCDHDHAHEHKHEHPHRAYRDIRAMLESSDLSDSVKRRALAIFHRIALAEAKIHGTSPEDIHFHEVGALDSIADIVGVCVGLEALGIQRVFASKLQDGHGWIDCAHGRFPVPAPAVLELLHGIPIQQTDEPHELITPTGAAILAEIAEGFGPMPEMITEKVGYGLGKRDLASRPNVLRAVLGSLTNH
jgi:uncharacterized protein (DUF111 family)